MNAKRRKEIEQIRESVTDLMERLNILSQEEQESYDNLPESLQDGERGERMQEAADSLQEAADNMEETINLLETAAQ